MDSVPVRPVQTGVEYVNSGDYQETVVELLERETWPQYIGHYIQVNIRDTRTVIHQFSSISNLDLGVSGPAVPSPYGTKSRPYPSQPQVPPHQLTSYKAYYSDSANAPKSTPPSPSPPTQQHSAHKTPPKDPPFA